jgi:hypothetical protein
MKRILFLASLIAIGAQVFVGLGLVNPSGAIAKEKPAVQNPLEKAPVKGAVNIVALGDSGIRGKGVSESEAFPAQLEAALRARGHNVSVSNAGINGDTTDGVLARLDASVPEGTDIVVLAVGVNDIVLHGQTKDYVDANKQSIVRRLKERGIQVFVLTKMQDGIYDRTDLHVEAAPTPGKTEWHLNAAGYAIVVQRTIGPIEAIVRKVERTPRS